MEKNLYIELNESLKLVFDTTSRIDERIKILIENNNEAKAKIERLYQQQIDLLNRIIILENKNNTQVLMDIKNEEAIINGKVKDLSDRCIRLENDVNQQSNKWSTTIDFIFKVSVAVIGSLILWKLGIKP